MGEAHYAVQRQKQGTFTALAQTTGLYRVCFSNRMSTLTEKTVAFSLHTGDQLYQDVAKQEHVTPLQNEVMQLADAITAVEDEQKYMWARERAARDSEWMQHRVVAGRLRFAAHGCFDCSFPFLCPRPSASCSEREHQLPRRVVQCAGICNHGCDWRLGDVYAQAVL